jgi:hypothetical protein
LRCTNAHPTQSGECQPAVGWIAPRGQCTANHVPTITTVESRAAGISPPWFGFALATATAYFRMSAFVRHDRFPHHGGLRPPLLCCDANVFRQKTIFAMHTGTSEQERRTSARRGSDSRLQRRSVFADRLRFAPHSRLPAPRLAHASRSWVHASLFLQNCDSRQRVAPVPRLAHASRSWVHARLFLQNCDARQRVASGTTAGLRQPLLGARRAFGVKCAISAARAHAHKNGERQPAVGWIRACNGDRFLRTDYVSPRTVASRHHGWLTPAAPGAATGPGD